MEMLYRLSYVGELLKRETGFEPATSCLEGKNSTTELLPHNSSPTILCGGGRIRTFEGKCRQIYSLLPLATRAPLLRARIGKAGSSLKSERDTALSPMAPH